MHAPKVLCNSQFLICFLMTFGWYKLLFTWRWSIMNRRCTYMQKPVVQNGIIHLHHHVGETETLCFLRFLFVSFPVINNVNDNGIICFEALPEKIDNFINIKPQVFKSLTASISHQDYLICSLDMVMKTKNFQYSFAYLPTCMLLEHRHVIL